MAVLFLSSTDDLTAWENALRQTLPDLDIRKWPETGPVEDIEAVLAWRYPPGELLRYPNLKLICSLGAGVDHLLSDPKLPANIPIVRIIDPAMTEGMSEYVIYGVIRFHRDFHNFEALQRQGVWKKIGQRAAKDCPVGILGLGEIGGDAAGKLAALGFDVAGWSRSPRQVPGIKTFHGADGLTEFLERTHILVCLLPLTPDTTGIINKKTLAALPQGAYVINAARGGHVVDADLIAALDSGHIAGALLDVFTPEPLPPEHPFWKHPKVSITPHVASITRPLTAAAQIADNIKRRRAGQPLTGLVDRNRGY
jgi:glyoxylate/hydroxypyruvate reductase